MGGVRTGALCLMIAHLAASLPAAAQEAASEGRLFRIDVEPVYGTLALAWPTASGWSLGGELGGGVGDGMVTLAGDDVPDEDLDFTPILHAGGFATRATGSRSALELGVRGGVADILEEVCPASDCFPELFGSAHVGWEWGGDTFRGATRLAVVRSQGETLLVWRPLFLRMRF